MLDIYKTHSFILQPPQLIVNNLFGDAYASMCLPLCVMCKDSTGWCTHKLRDFFFYRQ